MKLRIRLWPTLLTCFGIFLLLFVVIVGWRFLSIRSGQHAYEKRIAELAAKGTVVDEAGVNRLHAERSSPDLADQWRAIFDEFTKPEFIEASANLPYLGSGGAEKAPVPPRGEEWDVEKEARQFMVDYMQLRERVRKLAIKSKAVYFPLTRGKDDFGSNEAHLPIRTAQKLLVLDCVMALRYKADAIAIEDLRALVGLADFFQGEPTTMSFLINRGALGAALDIIQVGIEQHAFSEPLLKQVLSLLDSIKAPSEHFWLAVEGERAMTQTTLNEFAKKEGALRWLLGSPQARLVALDMYDRVQAISFDDLDKAIEGTDAVEDMGHRYSASVRYPTSADHYAPMGISGTLATAFSVIRQQSQVRISKLAIAIELYRIKNKKLPESLSDVAEFGVVAEQNMPVGGKPFGYRVSEDKTSAELWGFDLLSRNKVTPDEPPEVNPVLDDHPWWRWHLTLE